MTLSYKQKIKSILYATLCISICILLLCLLNIMTTKYLIYNPTKSEKQGYYIKIKADDIGYLKIYQISIPSTHIDMLHKLGLPTHIHSLLKTVVAKSQDVINVTSKGVLINNQLYPNSRGKLVARGVILHPIPIGYHHVLKENEYWVMGRTENSFDSRYFGVITQSQILNQVVFLF